MSTLNTYNLKSPDSANTNIALDASGNIAVRAGSAASPSIYITGDANTGLYSPGSDQVAISTSGAGRLFVDASGNVGVNTASILSPAGFGYARQIGITANTSGDSTVSINLQGSRTVDGAFADINFWHQSTSNRCWIAARREGTDADINLAFGTKNNERLRITSEGRVGLGTSNVSTNLEINAELDTGASVGLNEGQLSIGREANSGGAIRIGYDTTNNFGFISSGRVGISWDKLILNAGGGNIGIGSTSPTGQLSCTSDFVFGNQASTGSSGTGRIVATGGEVYFQGGLAAVSGSAAPIVFTNYGGVGERARLDASGRLLIGTSSSPGLTDGQYSKLHIVGNTNSASGDGFLNIGRGALASSGLAADTSLGSLQFTDSAGAVHASIGGLTDAATGTNDYPGRLVFRTAADGTNSPAERMRVTSNGYLKVSDTGTYRGPTAIYNEFNQSLNNNGLFVRCSNASFASTNLILDTVRAANSAYYFLLAMSGDGADNEFILRGDGNGLCDGSWTGGGADYAEYFEWLDSNPTAEDRRGISVVLEGDKIREAQTGEDPIGVISGNPSVVGDAAWNKWSGKYLRDEYGTYILDENGDRQLNSVYDPDMKYISREERPEWDCVGLMGKLRIRKGQATGSRWVKMRDISATVEEWLVR